MGSLSIWHILIVIVVVVVLFGRGKIPQVMDDLAKGIKSFKGGLDDLKKPEQAQLPPVDKDKT